MFVQYSEGLALKAGNRIIAALNIILINYTELIRFILLSTEQLGGIGSPCYALREKAVYR
jgi:hypothetical protein